MHALSDLNVFFIIKLQQLLSNAEYYHLHSIPVTGWYKSYIFHFRKIVWSLLSLGECRSYFFGEFLSHICKLIPLVRTKSISQNLTELIERISHEYPFGSTFYPSLTYKSVKCWTSGWLFIWQKKWIFYFWTKQ